MRIEKFFLIMAVIGWCGFIASTACEAASPLSIPTQLTHSLNYATAAAPDGKKLVTISVIANKGQIFVMGHRRLSSHPDHARRDRL